MATKQREGLSARTVQYIHAVLRRALGEAETWGLVGRNVAKLVRPPQVRKPEVRALDREEVAAMLKAAEKERLYPLIYTALTTGLRLGELLALTWGDIDLDAGQLHVKRTRRRTGTVAPPKTDAGRRSVPLPEPTREVLRSHRETQAAERAEACAWEQVDLVFTTQEGRPLLHRFVQRVWYRVLDKAEVDRCGFHHLRKTYTTMLAENGVPPRAAQQLLGHSNVRVTLEAYTHVSKHALAEAASHVGTTVAGMDQSDTSS